MSDASGQTVAVTSAADNVTAHRNHYAQFKRYLRRNLNYVLQLVQSADERLPEEVRQQALHTLSYGLGEEEYWATVSGILLALAPKLELAGHREDWLPYLVRGLEQSKVVGDLPTTAECHLQIGLLNRLLSDFDTARHHLQKSVELAQQNGNAHNQARALNELAWLEQLLEKYEDAELYVTQALALIPEEDIERAVSYRVQGMIAIGYQEWEKAEALHRRALSIFEQQCDSRRVAWSIQNLASAVHGQQKYHEAIDLYRQASRQLELINDQYHWSIIQTNLGISFYEVKKYDLAMLCYREAESIAKSLNDRFHLARIYTNIGLLDFSTGNYGNAAEAFRTSALLHNDLGNVRLSINAEDGLVMTLIAQGHHVEAATVAQAALVKLQHIQNSPRYYELLESLQSHLKEALHG
ncbi:MAG: tetratricopeptide repeat protein [Caldilineaceae bacterium]